MRSSTITSSIASVANHMIGSVAVAGKAVRTFLRLTTLREHTGYWLEPCQSGFDYAGGMRLDRLGNPLPGNKPGMQRRFGIAALAVCPAPSRLASVRTTRQG